MIRDFSLRSATDEVRVVELVAIAVVVAVVQAIVVLQL